MDDNKLTYLLLHYTIKLHVHSFCPFEDAQSCVIMMADPCPNMYLDGILGLVPGILTSLVATSSSMCFNMHSGLISVNGIFKRCIFICHPQIQSLLFIYISNH